MLQETELVDQLCRSTVYQDFERAFCEVTQFALRLSSPKNPSIACNGQVNGRQFSSATDVAVRLGDKIIGLLQIGRPALEAARAEHSKDSEKPIRVAGESMDFDRIPHASINSAGPSRSRYEAIVHLLELFANQLQCQNQNSPSRNLAVRSGAHKVRRIVAAAPVGLWR